ncbi:MAG: class I SAM-dependent RNA methyltransferase [Deltaproteobacteria bacterium]|nr:class I SAM-dependent RNA methyltransferase [Deltaproteobacteria bacterium]MCB9787024.1 class I SAM-dependent RNA methyltransferase [Deltaproteobacteria bacterium]
MAVPRAVPGDEVEAVVGEVRRGRIGTRLERVLRASPHRVEAPCPHFGRAGDLSPGCGGCSLQALEYSQQLEAKRAWVRRLLVAHGVDGELVLPPLGMARPLHYRNKMEFSFGRDAGGALSLGLHPGGYRHEVLLLERCLLMSEPGFALVRAVHRFADERGLEPLSSRTGEGFLRGLLVREGLRTGERMLDLVTTGLESTTMDGRVVAAAEVARAFRDAVLDAAQRLGAPVSSLYWTRHIAQRGSPTRMEAHHLDGQPVLHEKLHIAGLPPLRFAIHPRAFFQPNTSQAELLYGVVARAAGLDASAPARARLLDLYAGTGTIGLALAPLCREVIGIELVADAVENARANARANGITNARFVCGDVSEALGAEGLDQPGAADLVVVDPPRAGLMGGAVEALTRIAAPRLVYVSCNPASLARDLGPLRAAGFRLRSVQPVDMFPQTAHVENVALLERD